ncbi:MAG: class I SAM-dependent methyltransferase [archaeon]
MDYNKHWFMGFARKADYLRKQDILVNLEGFIEKEKTVLDVGCGNTVLSKETADKFKLKVSGVDLIEPVKQLIDFKLFNGRRIPFKDNSFDSVLLFDVLHHIRNEKEKQELLKECFRVSRNSIIIKDHYYSNFLQKQYLKAMDFTTNFLHKVKTPFNFISKQEWLEMKPQKLKFWKFKRIPQVMVKK